ncbi:hypothetical protein VTH06DRAFT_4917 [Thermothelomyces fergusii]
MSALSSGASSGKASPPSASPSQSAVNTPATGSSRASSGANTPRGSKKKIRILMLHGYTQSGPIFKGKTNGLQKRLAKALATLGLEPVLIYPTAPNRLTVDDVVGWERRQEPIADYEPDTWAWYRSDERQRRYLYLEEGMSRIAEALRQAREEARQEGDEDGAVEGVIGFSQGGCMAAMLASALEGAHRPRGEGGEDGEDKGEGEGEARAHERWLEAVREANGGRPLKFAVVYGGFRAAPADLGWLYSPRIATPTMHWIGSLDTVVSEERSMGLVDQCVDPVVVNHPGGHFVPIDPRSVNALVSFIHQYVQGKKDQKAQQQGGEEGAGKDDDDGLL